MLLAACAGAGGIRPRYEALPEARQTTINQGPAVVTQLVDNALRGANLPIAVTATREGYVETAWFDVDSRQRAGRPFSNMDRVVKLRFFVDPSQGQTRVLAECVQLIAWDPSVPERELERMVPADHPGRTLLDSIVAAVAPPPAARPAPMSNNQ